MKILFWACLLLGVAEHGRAETLDRGRMAPEIFLRTESFRVPPEAGNGARGLEVVYGNSRVGYFRQSRVARQGADIRITLIPPTYLHPVEFSLRFEDDSGATKTFSLGKKKYQHPAPEVGNPGIRVFGNPTFNFALISQSFVSRNDEEDFFIPVIINRLGETVWYSVLTPGQKKSIRYGVMFEQLEGGVYAFLKRTLETELTVMRFDGKILKHVDFEKERLPPNSHGFKYLPESRELIYLSFDCRELPWYREHSPVFSGFLNWWRLFTLPRRTYLGGKLIRLDLDTLKYREVWSSFNDFSPNRDKSLYTMPYNGSDPFIDMESPHAYLSAVKSPQEWAGWEQPKCHVDWTHENSVDYRPGLGYLVSIRNLNKVVLVDESGKLRWTLGEGAGNSFRFRYDGSAFSHQHSASFLAGRRILLFDNNLPHRGSVGERRVNRVMTIRLPEEPGEIAPEWSAPLPAYQSVIRGSASPLPGGRVFAYVPGPPGATESLIELDPADASRTARIRIFTSTPLHGIEAKPLMTLGDETLLRAGTNEERPEAGAETTRALDPQTMIDTSY